MEVVFPRCAGLDVHKATVVACLVVTGADGRRTKETPTFATTTDALVALGTGCGRLAAGRSRWSRPGCTGSRCTTS